MFSGDVEELKNCILMNTEESYWSDENICSPQGYNNIVFIQALSPGSLCMHVELEASATVPPEAQVNKVMNWM